MSCKPIIYNFTVSPLTITGQDSVRINWSISGHPTLLTHTDTTNQPGYEFREYSLVVEKMGRQTRRSALVNVLPYQSNDIIEFSSIRLGDTLIARGEKNDRRWGEHFIVQTVRSFSNRLLFVRHDGVTAELPADSSISTVFKGLSNSGNWEIRTFLTESEKKDSTSIPSVLQIQMILLFKK